MDAKVKNVWQQVNEGLMPQYGTGLHWPYCQQAGCTGCLPERDLPEAPESTFDLSIFRKEE